MKKLGGKFDWVKYRDQDALPELGGFSGGAEYRHAGNRKG
jgi:hypothetical protein